MSKHPRRMSRNDPAFARYPVAMTGLLSIGRPKESYNYEEWAERLRGHVPELIAMTIDDELYGRASDDRAVWAPLHALRILTLLGPDEAAGPLLQIMDLDDDWFADDLPEFYGAIGSSAIPLLSEYIAEPTNDVWGRSRAADSLRIIAQRHPETYDEIVQVLTGLLDRPGADDSVEEERLTAMIIGDLGELKAVASYDAIRRAYAEDRVEITYIGLEDVERDFGMRPPLDFSALPLPKQANDERGVRLVLECKSCGREREYFFERAYFDLGTDVTPVSDQDYNPLIIPEPVVCRKCGAVDQYALGSLEFAALTGKMLGLLAPSSDFPVSSAFDVQFVDYRTPWGRMHPQAAIERYEEELARQPNDVALLVNLGNAQRILGKYEEAQASYERALTLDALNLDAWVSLAQLAGLRKDFGAAIRGWEKVLELLPDTELNEEEHEFIADEAQKALGDLRRGVAPEFEPEYAVNPRPPAAIDEPPRQLPVVTPAEQAAPPPVQMAPVTPDLGPYGKVGRNERCPCGSGKKFKHCHGQKVKAS